MADGVEMFCLCFQMHPGEDPLVSHFRRLYYNILMGFRNFPGAFSRPGEENHDVHPELWAGQDSVTTALLRCFHVGRDCSPCGEALKALVGIIDKDPVFVLIVTLRVVTCGHCWFKNIRFWKLVEI